MPWIMNSIKCPLLLQPDGSTSGITCRTFCGGGDNAGFHILCSMAKDVSVIIYRYLIEQHRQPVPTYISVELDYKNEHIRRLGLFLGGVANPADPCRPPHPLPPSPSQKSIKINDPAKDHLSCVWNFYNLYHEWTCRDGALYRIQGNGERKVRLPKSCR